MANLITGDAVTLDLRVAGLPSRSLALVVDLGVQIALLVTVLILAEWVFPAGSSAGAQAAITLGVTVLALVGWPTLIETVTRGRSLGKRMMGLRVVRDDGGPVRLRHSLVRALAMVFLDLWVTSGVVGGISALASSKSKRMGDHLAGTVVVGERIPRSVTRQAQIMMPPPLAAWAASLDLVAVPDGLALNVRTFLHRAADLNPGVRRTTAERLATQTAGYVRTPAPPGTPAEAYLMAVLAERTRRASLPASPPVPAHGSGPHSPGAGAHGQAPSAPPPAPPAGRARPDAAPAGRPPSGPAPGFTRPS